MESKPSISMDAHSQGSQTSGNKDAPAALWTRIPGEEMRLPTTSQHQLASPMSEAPCK